MGLDDLLENQLGLLLKFHITPFLPQGAEIELILLYGQRFPRYGSIFNIAIFGH